MGYDFELRDAPSVIHPAHGDGKATLLVDGRPVHVKLLPTAKDGEFILELNGVCEPIFVASQGDLHFVHLRGRAHRVEAINALERAKRKAAPLDSAKILTAPMPGVVVEVLVEEDDMVEAGQLLMTIESMKLQTPIVAPHDGRVAELRLHAGASFEHGAVLVRLESCDDEGGETK